MCAGYEDHKITAECKQLWSPELSSKEGSVSRLSWDLWHVTALFITSLRIRKRVPKFHLGLPAGGHALTITESCPCPFLVMRNLQTFWQAFPSGPHSWAAFFRRRITQSHPESSLDEAGSEGNELWADIAGGASSPRPTLTATTSRGRTEQARAGRWVWESPHGPWHSRRESASVS